ncbi:MAG: dihydrofolate reductase [Bacteroidales bacterium]|nr:dihydrofolate reductase [Bacteroidales bacterium]MDY6000928.1 dihydrofolate reductase [Candidatus Cryptobacteroides sp.]
MKEAFMEKCIIVAIADNYAIGKNNSMLWHISEDMKYFRQTTTGSPVIMGFRTFESIGSRPLPKRENIVISTHAWPEELSGLLDVSTGKHVRTACSLDEAYSLAASNASVQAQGGCERMGKVFIMGGGETYRKALPTADKLYVTHVHATIGDADTFFPFIDEGIWKIDSQSEEMTDPETGYTFCFTVYSRR